MISKKKFANLMALSIFLITSACGGYPATAPMPEIYQVTNTQTSDEEECCCEDETTDNSTSVKDDTNTSTTTKDDNKEDKTTDTKTDTKVEDTKKDTTTDNSASISKGRKALDKVMEYISNAKTIESEVDKYEKSISNAGVSTQQTLKIYTRLSPQKQVKLEIIKHTKPNNVGAKVLYTVGTGKATIRPGGALSFMKLDLDQSDDKITSPNNYTPESCDYFSMAKRLSGKDYEAEITGKTTLDGKEVYLLKIIKKKGVNELDSRIKYEVIGFDSKTYEVKLWEAYAGEATPYMKMSIKYVKKDLDLADSIFKI